MIHDENTVTQNLDDREILDDILTSQKQITGSYNTFGNECVNEKLRSDFLNILRDEHNLQSDVFTQMQQRGWYTPCAAPQQKIDQAKTKFQNMASSLC